MQHNQERVYLLSGCASIAQPKVDWGFQVSTFGMNNLVCTHCTFFVMIVSVARVAEVSLCWLGVGCAGNWKGLGKDDIPYAASFFRFR